MVVIVVMNCNRFSLMMSHKRVPFDKYSLSTHTNGFGDKYEKGREGRENRDSHSVFPTAITTPAFHTLICSAFAQHLLHAKQTIENWVNIFRQFWYLERIFFIDLEELLFEHFFYVSQYVFVRFFDKFKAKREKLANSWISLPCRAIRFLVDITKMFSFVLRYISLFSSHFPSN